MEVGASIVVEHDAPRHGDIDPVRADVGETVVRNTRVADAAEADSVTDEMIEGRSVDDDVVVAFDIDAVALNIAAVERPAVTRRPRDAVQPGAAELGGGGVDRDRRRPVAILDRDRRGGGRGGNERDQYRS